MEIWSCAQDHVLELCHKRFVAFGSGRIPCRATIGWPKRPLPFLMRKVNDFCTFRGLTIAQRMDACVPAVQAFRHAQVQAAPFPLQRALPFECPAIFRCPLCFLKQSRAIVVRLSCVEKSATLPSMHSRRRTPNSRVAQKARNEERLAH